LYVIAENSAFRENSMASPGVALSDITRNAGGVAACGQWQAFHFF